MELALNDTKALSATRKSVIHIHRPLAIAVLELCRGGVGLPSREHRSACAVQLVANVHYHQVESFCSTGGGLWNTAD